MASPSHSTNTLLIRLQQNTADDGLARQFVERYTPQFYGWCRRHGLQDADAQELTQETFARVFAGLKTFNKERGNARGWLFQILRNSVRDYGSRNRDRAVGGEAAAALLESQEAMADLEQRLAEEFDLERRKVAEHNVRERLGEVTWAAYELTCLQGLSDTEAAERLNIPRANIIRYRSRVIEMLQKEIRRLADLEEGRPES